MLDFWKILITFVLLFSYEKHKKILRLLHCL